MIAAIPQGRTSKQSTVHKIEQVLEAVGPRKWTTNERRILAHELDEVHAPWQNVQQNAQRFYGVLPGTESIPRPYRAFLAMSVAVALGAVR